MKICVTGGAGFIGSNFVRLLLSERPDIEIVNVDLLTYAGNLGNLSDVLENPRHQFIRADIADGEGLRKELPGDIDLLINFAAESHVDRSIANAGEFVRTNIGGTQVLLDLARERQIPRFVQVSTDEVYGSLGPTGRFTEDSPLRPNSPYAASKAAADLLVLAAHRTHGLDVVVTRCSNNFGPWQFPEKLIPLMILNAAGDEPLPVYGDGRNVRDWIHVEDHCRAVLAAAERGAPGQVYNIGADSEWENLALVREILGILGKPESLIRYVTDRPGHDRRYAIDSARARRDLDWAPRLQIDTALPGVVEWYLEHGDWTGQVRSGEYRRFYSEWYEGRLADDDEGR